MKRKSKSQLLAEVASFNHCNPVGTTVVVTKDDGSMVADKTRSEAWVSGGHSAVIMLEHFSGAYSLDRVQRATEQP